MSPEEWAEKFGDELCADAGDWCWNKQHEEKLALYFGQAIKEAKNGENNDEKRLRD